MEEIVFIIMERPQQVAIARAVSQELAMQDLEQWTDVPGIAQAYKRLSVFLPQEATLIDPQWVAPFSPLHDASHDAERYLHLANHKAQQRVLQSMIANLEKTRAKTPFRDAALNNRLSQVVNTWLDITQQAYKRLRVDPSLIGQIDNPFSPGDPLKLHDSLFVGRLDLAQQLEEGLSRKHHRPTFLLNGERRMGKTSVLMQLPSLLGPHYLPIFYDLQQRGASSSTSAFLTSVAREICKFMQSQGMRAERLEYARLQEASQKNEAAAYHLFEVWLNDIEQDLEQEDKTLLLTFDEFEMLAEAGHAVYLDLKLLLDWFHNLIQNHPRLVLLFSGERTFSEMGSHWVSHFVTVQTLRVSFLRPAEVRKLIAQLDDPDVSAEPPFSEDIVEEIIRVTACHPFLVQALCSVLIDSLNLEERTQACLSDVEMAVQQVLDRWHDYFLDVWIRADDDQKSCLTTIARLDVCNPLDVEQQTGLDDQTVRRTLQKLLKRDLIRVEDGNYHIAVPIFVEWMEQNNDVAELDSHDFSWSHGDDLPVNDDSESSDSLEITILPSILHPNIGKLERNTEKRTAFERENWVLPSRSTIQSSLMRPAPLRSTQLLLISLTLLFIIVGGVLIAPTVLNSFTNKPPIAKTTARVTNPYGQGGTLMINDPLSRQDYWVEASGTTGSCKFEGGEYHIQTAGYFVFPCLTNRSFSNFAFEVQMTFITGDAGGFEFHLDSTTSTFYRFLITPTGQYRILRGNSSSLKVLVDFTHNSAISQGYGQTNTLALVANGNTIIFYVNHVQVYRITASAYSQGDIALAASAPYGNSTEVAFTNAKVWTF